MGKAVCCLVGSLLESHLPGLLKEALSRKREPEKGGSTGNSPKRARARLLGQSHAERARGVKGGEERGGGEKEGRGRDGGKRRAGRGREGRSAS